MGYATKRVGYHTQKAGYHTQKGRLSCPKGGLSHPKGWITIPFPSNQPTPPPAGNYSASCLPCESHSDQGSEDTVSCRSCRPSPFEPHQVMNSREDWGPNIGACWYMGPAMTKCESRNKQERSLPLMQWNSKGPSCRWMKVMRSLNLRSPAPHSPLSATSQGRRPFHWNQLAWNVQSWRAR